MKQPAGPVIKINGLPPHPTPFIGRREDIAAVGQLLADPACRLLTLIGVGGIGKTRLAIKAATHLLGHPAPSGSSPPEANPTASPPATEKRQSRFTDGAYFVALQPVTSTEYLVSAVADAINFLLSGRDEPRVQLLNHLRQKKMLLLLDNFEHLLSVLDEDITGGEALLANILTAAPGVKLLVTSREVLNLQEEWLYPVEGMSFPQTDQADGLEAYEAVQLFVERAHRVCRDFSLAGEREHVIRICQLVEGVPLAIELAAAWTKTLDCAVIAAEIQRNLDFLATSLRDMPDRQQSMRAVFDYSWQLLSGNERSAFRRLSVFRGGFRREAAERIAGASLSTLSALVDKSLLRSVPDNRYQIHELLRQYAGEHLVQSPNDVAHIYDWHCAYYADFLHEQWEGMLGGRQLESASEIAADLENVRIAWQWAAEQLKIEEIQKAAGPLMIFYQFQSRYLEGATALERVARRLMDETPTGQIDLALVTILVHLGWFYIRLGQLEEAETALDRCRAIYDRLDRPPVPGFATDPVLALGIIASIRGDYAAAARLGEQGRQVSEAHHHRGNRQLAYYLLARAALLQGDSEAAHHHAQQAYAITQEAGDRWFMAYCLNELGHVACALHEYGAAKGHYEASYALRQEFNDPEGMALALSHLGGIALLEENYSEAKQLFQQSLGVYKGTNDRGGLARALNGLGNAAMAVGDFQAAKEQYRRALQIATEIEFVPLVLAVLIGISELLLRTGYTQRGLELLALVMHHPAGEPETKARVQRLLTTYETKFSADLPAAAGQSKPGDDLAAVAIDLLAELSTLEAPAELADLPLPPVIPKDDQALIEPLSERELEVLHYVAAGLQNREIAAKLTVTLSTVKAHINHIYRKLEVNNRVQAVSRAQELDLLP